MSVVALTAATLFGFWMAAPAAPGASTARSTLPNHRRSDLTTPADGQRLKGDLERMIQDESRFLAQRKAQRQEWREQKPLAEMSRAELLRYFGEPLAAPSNNELRGLRELQSLLDRWEHAPDPATRTNAVHLGKGAGVFSWHSDQPNLFAWTCTAPPQQPGKGRMTIPFRIVNYRPIDPVLAFANMTWADARWMTRWIGQLSEAQLVAGLIGSGFDAAEVRLLTEKLVSRRDQMIKDLRLTSEIPLLRSAGPQRDFDYRPQTEGTMTAVLPDGTRVAARVTDQYIRHGHIVTPVKMP